MKRFFSRDTRSACIVAGLVTLVALVACQAAVAADPGQGVTFRDLVRKYASDADGKALAKQIGFSQSVKHVVALEYTILLRSDGDERAVDPKTYQFQLGDQIRVRIEPIDDAYIYIFTEGPTGQRQCLLPKNDRGEKAPFVKRGTKVHLPDDGWIEFSPPAGTEQLLVVATEKPTEDLAGLANVVFGKPDDQLTPQEKEIKKTLQAKAKAKLESIRRRQSDSITYRGLLTRQALGKVARQMQQEGRFRSVLEEPPSGKQDGTFAMVASTRQNDRPSLMVRIALTSVSGKSGRP